MSLESNTKYVHTSDDKKRKYILESTLFGEN